MDRSVCPDVTEVSPKKMKNAEMYDLQEPSFVIVPRHNLYP